MTVRLCEACAAPIYKPEEGQLLCDLCAKTIDEATDLYLEIYYYERNLGDE